MPLPGSPGQVKYTGGHGVRGLASPDPFLGAFRGVPYHRPWKMWSGSACACCWGTDRGMPVPQILLEEWKWPASGVLPLVQFLDKVADLPVVSMTGAWGRQCRKLRHSQLQC